MEISYMLGKNSLTRPIRKITALCFMNNANRNLYYASLCTLTEMDRFEQDECKII